MSTSSGSDVRPDRDESASIDVAGVSMRFRSYGDSAPSLKQAALNTLLRRTYRHTRDFWLFRELSVSVGHGERLGIVGPNGAGKSTLLKLIGGIYTPTSGSIGIRGRIAPLIELGAGMLPELSGAENILLNGVLMGFSRREMVGKVDPILDFAGLQEFRDMPTKYYSSGMMLRLAFSTATDIDPEILLIDEVFASGDAEFIVKAKARMERLLDESHIVVMVSHQLDLITDICTRAIWLDHGRIVADGEPADVTRRYLEHAVPPQPAATP